jgi:crossover junction endodeoxyribonuclease RusA
MGDPTQLDDRMVLRFTCAWPAPELWQNSRAHHMQRHRATKAARHEAEILAIQAGARAIRWREAYLVSVTFRPSPRSRADMQNLPATVKAHIDGIADALGVDDRVFSVAFQVADKGGPGAVEFQVEPVE